MTFRLRKTDCDVLMTVAEFRFLTVTQLAVLFNKNRQAISRRLAEIRDARLLKSEPHQLGHNRGRPEMLYSITDEAVGCLRKWAHISQDLRVEDLVLETLSCPVHQILLNWFRLNLRSVERKVPRLRIQFLAYNSPFQARTVPVKLDNTPGNRFVPDGVFSVFDTERQQALLFFLEVDMGSETLASLKRECTDIRQKLLNYGEYFDCKQYKKYEQLWHQSYHGFRLLFLTNTLHRLKDLCTLVQAMPPSDYVWLTEQNRLFQEGAGGSIWNRGGRLEESPRSMLGTLGCKTPLASKY